ncbi:helix-turn-helix transcriptional regulator [Streptomyces sp. NPDC040750]|uniref:helix-turn-helix domain-containing protein n=1 Tax=Streptomyces sp. NPDC040750 TaxID=3154491 RepID=UPI0033E3E8F7
MSAEEVRRDHDGSVEEFAAQLRELKTRTGRSYGSLARRVGMNTSTLHRYCAGEAVPQDFAPVERLAAFCGATREERLDLHRRWLHALTARQLPRGSGEQAMDGRTTDGRQPRATEPAATAPEPPAGRPTPGPPDTGPLHRPPPVSAASARAPWFRGRRRVVGAVAAVLVMALGAGWAVRASEGSPPGRAARRSVVAGARTPAGDPSPRTPSRSSSPSPSPSSSPSGGPGASAPPAGPSPTTATTRTTGSPAVPLTWTADSQVWELGCDHDYVIGKEPADVPPPPAPQDAGGWAATQGAVHGHDTEVRISVQGRSGTAVVLEALRVRVVGRTAPLRGNAYSMAQGCGGDMSPRHFTVDLDKDRPIARPAPATAEGTRRPVVPLPYRVSAKDPEVLLVEASTDGCDCRWYLELDWSSEGRTGTVRVDDHGRPFRTSAIKGLPHYWYGSEGGERRWVPLAD